MQGVQNVIMDINGNKVGTAKVTGRRPSDE
jgi:hypothetical protein